MEPPCLTNTTGDSKPHSHIHNFFFMEVFIMIYSAPTPITAHQEGVTGRTHGVAVETIGKTQPYTSEQIR